MKFILHFFIVTILAVGFVRGQDTKEAGYLRFPTVPPFTVVGLDSSIYTKADLKKNSETIIMYFNPGCDHCRHQLDSLIANMDKFKKMQIVMATYQPMDDIKEFYKEFKLKQYPNIHIGRDSKYFFQPFYKIMNLPFLALYDKKGKLLTTFEGTTPVKKLTEAFNKK